MADWKKVTMALALADGVIDKTECAVLKKELYKDKKIDKEEVQFLAELRQAYAKKAKSKGVEVSDEFNKLFFDALRDYVLADDVINAREARLLREIIFADKKVDEQEKKFVQTLKKKAKRVSSEFDALYAECMAR